MLRFLMWCFVTAIVVYLFLMMAAIFVINKWLCQWSQTISNCYNEIVWTK